MRKNNLIYFAVNTLFIVIALFFINYTNLFNLNLSFPKILWVLLLFFLIHTTRFIRMYFILLEDLIKPSRFLQLYIKTTFVSTLIPFKIGELFKMYCYGIETNNTMKGVIAVIIEKFFDALVLCFFIIPYAIKNNTINPLLIILATFMLIISVLYFSFDGTYKYLNKFLICHGGGKKSLAVLKILEGIKKGYDSAKQTVKGRFVLLLFLSLLAWTAEGLLVIILNTNSEFNFGAALSYVNDVFFGIANPAFNYYTSLCVIIFFIILTAIYGKKYLEIIKEHRRKQV